MKEFDTVRVRRLSDPVPRMYIGDRPPALGDEGTIVDIKRDGVCAVECVADDGATIWLADFRAEELEVTFSPPPNVA